MIQAIKPLANQRTWRWPSRPASPPPPAWKSRRQSCEAHPDARAPTLLRSFPTARGGWASANMARLASKPVMEGRPVLFSRNSPHVMSSNSESPPTPSSACETVLRWSRTSAAFQSQDIKRDRNVFETRRAAEKRMKIPFLS